LRKTRRTKMRMKIKMSDQYVDSVLAEAQRLLWGGSETENIAAHNLIAKLIKDRLPDEEVE
jgi:hypothetical protein